MYKITTSSNGTPRGVVRPPQKPSLVPRGQQDSLSRDTKLSSTRIGIVGSPHRIILLLVHLCRSLCRNPAIPTEVCLCQRVLLYDKQETADGDQSRMNTAAQYHSHSLGVAGCFWWQRTVTAEAAGSSPVDPAIIPKNLWDDGLKIPIHNPIHNSLDCLRFHSQGCQELTLRRPCFVTVLLRIKIQRRLNLRVAEDSLHRFRLYLCLVHQPITERVPKVMQTEALAFCDGNASRNGGGPQIVRDERRRIERFSALLPDRWKYEVRWLRVGRMRVPFTQMQRQDRMHGNVAVRCLGLGFSVFSFPLQNNTAFGVG